MGFLGFGGKNNNNGQPAAPGGQEVTPTSTTPPVDINKTQPDSIFPTPGASAVPTPTAEIPTYSAPAAPVTGETTAPGGLPVTPAPAEVSSAVNETPQNLNEASTWAAATAEKDKLKDASVQAPPVVPPVAETKLPPGASENLNIGDGTITTSPLANSGGVDSPTEETTNKVLSASAEAGSTLGVTDTVPAVAETPIQGLETVAPEVATPVAAETPAADTGTVTEAAGTGIGLSGVNSFETQQDTAVVPGATPIGSTGQAPEVSATGFGVPSDSSAVAETGAVTPAPEVPTLETPTDSTAAEKPAVDPLATLLGETPTSKPDVIPDVAPIEVNTLDTIGAVSPAPEAVVADAITTAEPTVLPTAATEPVVNPTLDANPPENITAFPGTTPEVPASTGDVAPTTDATPTPAAAPTEPVSTEPGSSDSSSSTGGGMPQTA